MKASFIRSRLPLISCALFAGLLIFLSCVTPPLYAQAPAPTPAPQSKQWAPEMTLDLMMEKLQSTKATQAQKNAAITKAVNAYGIDFVLTDDVEQQLRSVGADNPLITAIRKKSDKLANTPYYYAKIAEKFLAEGKKFNALAETARAQNNQDETQKNSSEARRNFDEAIANYNKAIGVDANDKTSYNNLGVIYDLLNRYDDAIASFTRVIDIEPTVSRYINRALIYEKRGMTKQGAERRADFDRAIEDYTQAIRIEPTYTGAYKRRADAYGFWGRKEEQAADLKRIADIRAGITPNP